MIGSQIDFTKPLIKTIPGVLTDKDCRQWIERIRSAGPELATIETHRGAIIDVSVRNNRRVMFDDADAALDLFDRIKDEAPSEIQGMKLCGVNERLRCYEYQPGQRFNMHQDGPYQRDEREWSRYTFMVYLNEDFQGGETVFLVEPETKITPKTGMALLFQHPIIHEGAEVTSGTKYVIRTDLMYHWPLRLV